MTVLLLHPSSTYSQVDFYWELQQRQLSTLASFSVYTDGSGFGSSHFAFNTKNNVSWKTVFYL